MRQALENTAVEKTHLNSVGSHMVLPKLEIGKPDDKFEKEADAVADQVMRMPDPSNHVQMKRYDSAPRISMKCAKCEEEEKLQMKPSLQRSSEGNTHYADTDLTQKLNNTKGAGNTLPEHISHEMGSKIGTNFSSVKIHTDANAIQMNRELGAKAFTHGRDIYFNRDQYNPSSSEGKHLLAHELTHVVQQNANPIIQKQDDAYNTSLKKSVTDKEAKEKDSGESQEGLEQQQKLLRLTDAIDLALAGDKDKKNEIPALREDFDQSMIDFKPDIGLQERMDRYFDPTYGVYSRVLSRYLADDIAARLSILGLHEDSKKFRKYAVRSVPTETKSHEKERFAGSVDEAVSVLTKDPAILKQDTTLELLMEACRTLFIEIEKFNSFKELEEDHKTRVSLFPDLNDHKQIAYLFDSSLLLYTLEVLGRAYGGVQAHIQLHMDEAVNELHSTGNTQKLGIIESKLNLVKSLITYKGSFVKDGDFVAKNFPVAVTSSKFSKTDSKHYDYFGDKDDSEPRLKINFYDEKQESGKEKELTLERILSIRFRQLDTIRYLFNLGTVPGNLQADATHNQQIIESQFQGKFNIHSNEHWKEFLKAKFDDLINAQNKSKAEAFMLVIDVLRNYLVAFTMSTPFDIDDFAENYLDKEFPRAMTGQLIHDCGIFAMRIVYLLSLISDHLGLKISYILLPNHIGLIISGDGIPLLIVHNNSFSAYLLDDTQKASVSEDTRLKFGRSDSHTLEETRKFWDQAVADGVGPTPKDPDKQFLGELAGSRFNPHVDMPFKIIDVNKSNWSSFTKLWAHYKKAAGQNLFTDVISKESSGFYQIHLNYLKFIEQYKVFHNQVLLPFWNVDAQEVWKKYEAELSGGQSKEEYEAKAKKYLLELGAKWTPVIDKFNELVTRKNDLSIVIESNKGKLINTKGGAMLIDGERTFNLFMYYWVTDITAHMKAVEKTFNKPPFADKSDMMEPMD